MSDDNTIFPGGVGAIARRFDMPVSRVEYVLRTRPDLKPLGRIGNARLFGQATVEKIGEELERIAAARKPAAGAVAVAG